MPNGGTRLGRCDQCRVYGPVHLRHAEDYMYWTCFYCDACMDWIDLDEEHWVLFRIMQMVDQSMSHPLSQIIASLDIGLTIASFRVRRYDDED